MGLRNTRGTCPAGGWRWVRGYEVGHPEVSCSRATPSPARGDTDLGTNILARTLGKLCLGLRGFSPALSLRPVMLPVIFSGPSLPRKGVLRVWDGVWLTSGCDVPLGWWREPGAPLRGQGTATQVPGSSQSHRHGRAGTRWPRPGAAGTKPPRTRSPSCRHGEGKAPRVPPPPAPRLLLFAHHHHFGQTLAQRRQQILPTASSSDSSQHAQRHRCLYPFISSPFCVLAGGRPSAGTGQAPGRCWPCCGRGFAPRSAPRVKPSSH